MAVLESCYFEPNHIPNSESDRSEDRKVDHAWKNTFCWPCEGFKSVAGFLLAANFESD